MMGYRAFLQQILDTAKEILLKIRPENSGSAFESGIKLSKFKIKSQMKEEIKRE